MLNPAIADARVEGGDDDNNNGDDDDAALVPQPLPLPLSAIPVAHRPLPPVLPPPPKNGGRGLVVANPNFEEENY